MGEGKSERVFRQGGKTTTRAESNGRRGHLEKNSKSWPLSCSPTRKRKGGPGGNARNKGPNVSITLEKTIPILRKGLPFFHYQRKPDKERNVSEKIQNEKEATSLGARKGKKKSSHSPAQKSETKTIQQKKTPREGKLQENTEE